MIIRLSTKLVPIAVGVCVLTHEAGATPGYIQKSSGGTDTATPIYENGQYIGIGTTNPQSALHVLGRKIFLEDVTDNPDAPFSLAVIDNSGTDWFLIEKPTTSGLRLSSTFEGNRLTVYGYVQWSIDNGALMDKNGWQRVVFIKDGDLRLASDTGAPKIEIDSVNDQVVLGGGNPASSNYEVTVNNDLWVTGNSYFAGQGTHQFQGHLHAPQIDADLAGPGVISIYAAGNVWFDSTLDLQGPAYFEDTLTVSEAASFGSTLYVAGSVTADDFIETSPYPESSDLAYAAVLSVQRLPDGDFDPLNTDAQMDHAELHEFIRRSLPGGRTGVSLSALVSAQNEVIKDLIERVDLLEAQLAKNSSNPPKRPVRAEPKR